MGADGADGYFRLGWTEYEHFERARRSPVIGAPARQWATRERCWSLLSFGARSQEKGWGKETHRAGRVFRFAVRVEKHSFRGFFFFFSLSPPPVSSPQLKNIKHMKCIS